MSLQKRLSMLTMDTKFHCFSHSGREAFWGKVRTLHVPYLLKFSDPSFLSFFTMCL